MSIASRVRGLLFKAASAAITVATGVNLTDLRLGRFLAGGPTYSGKSVTVDSALQLDAVWACVRLIAETIATLPLQLYARDAAGNGTVARDHPLYRILHDAPNADMTAVEFWECMIACLLLWGNGFAQIMRRGDGTIIALNPLRPDRMTVRRNAAGALEYTYAYQGVVLVLEEGDVFHLKGFSLDGLMGLSPVSVARNALGTAMAAEEVAGRVFANGLFAQSYIKSPDWLGDDKVARAKEILADYTGALNAGRTPLLEGNWSVETIGMKPEDLQLLTTRGFHVEVIARWFGVPPDMIGRTEKSTSWGTGLEQMMLRFLMFSLRPYLKRIEQAIARDLLSPGDRVTYYAEFNLEGLLRADSAARAAFYGAMVDKGIMTRNEVRALENLPPMDGGDVLTVQAQMIPIGDVGKIAVLPSEQPLPDESKFNWSKLIDRIREVA